MSLPFRMYLGLVVFSLFGTLLSRVTGLNPGPIAPAASLLMIGLATWVCVRGLPWLPVVWVFLIGAGSEVCGIYTGLPFGDYSYTDRWWPVVRLWGGENYPLLLPFAWLMMALSSLRIASMRGMGVVQTALLAGGIAMLVDIPMEFVMAGRLRYWTWESVTWPLASPWLNSVGWFVVVFVASLVMLRVPAFSDRQDPEDRWILPVHAAFTLLLGALSA